MQIAYPYRLNGSGRTANQDKEDAHIREMIEQVLFTFPGERVNRPDFGIGLLSFVFGKTSEEAVAACQFMVQGELQQWLGDLIDIESVNVTAEESQLSVTVVYQVIRTRQRTIAKFTS